MKRLVWLVFCVLMISSCFGFSSCKKETEVGCRYEITTEYREESETLSGAVKVEYINQTGKDLTELKFNLYPNAYRKNALHPPLSENYFSTAYYDGADYGGITITSVNGAKSWSIDGVDENILTARLLSPLSAGDKIILDVSFVTELAKIEHRLGVTTKTVNFGNAFPCLCVCEQGEFIETAYSTFGDPFKSDYANYKVNLTVPSGYVVAASGASVATKGLESKTKYELTIENAKDFAFVISEKFEIAETTVGDTVIKYYYYDDKDATAHLSLIKDCFSYYSELYGEYPYETYSVAQTGFCYGGMEYPALVMISDKLGERELIRSIAHETAHQWWYATVGSDQVNDSWQDESLAEYSAVLFFEDHSAYGIDRANSVKECLKEYRSYFSVYGSVFGQIDTKMRRPLSAYSSEYEYRCLSYDKGVIMWDSLQKSIGDKKFFQGLRNYYKDCKFKNATPKALISAFEKTGVSVEGFFDSFLLGKTVI